MILALPLLLALALSPAAEAKTDVKAEIAPEPKVQILPDASVVDAAPATPLIAAAILRLDAAVGQAIPASDPNPDRSVAFLMVRMLQEIRDACAGRPEAQDADCILEGISVGIRWASTDLPAILARPGR